MMNDLQCSVVSFNLFSLLSHLYHAPIAQQLAQIVVFAIALHSRGWDEIY